MRNEQGIYQRLHLQNSEDLKLEVMQLMFEV